MSFDAGKRERALRRVTVGRHIAMGILFIVLAYPVWKYRTFGTIELSVITADCLAGLMAVYGIFRMYRGIQDARYRDDDGR